GHGRLPAGLRRDRRGLRARARASTRGTVQPGPDAMIVAVPSPRTLPPTTRDLERADARPYFLWWSDVSVRELRRLLRSSEPDERAYWMGALLREANTRDVWLFVSPAEIRAAWPSLQRHLGRARDMWAYLLGLPAPTWPPPEARGA